MIQRRLLTSPVRPGLVTIASVWCQALVSDVGLGHNDGYRIEVCVEEVATNLVKYGGCTRPVRWSAEVEERRVRLQFVDECVPFDPLTYHPTPLPATLAELEVGGRGIQLLRALSDACSYEHVDGRNRLTLVFDLDEPAHAPKRPEGLREVSIFRHVADEVVDRALGALTVQDVGDDMLLLERGEPNHSVLLLLDGSVRVYLDRPDGDEYVPVGPGECVGEMSVIDDHPVSAHVRADGGSRLLVVDAHTFLTQVLALPEVARNLLSAQAERMRRADLLTIERMRQLMAMEQARRELEYARSIQASLLPEEPLFPGDARLDCVGRMRPAHDVGGDFYDVFLLDARHLLVIVADVVGKGLPAALFMVRAVSALRALPRRHDSSERELEYLMGTLNEQLCEHNAARQFMTAFCGVLDLETYRFQYVIAGHNPPLLSVGDGPFEYLREPVNPPVGLAPGLRFRGGEVQLDRAGRLLLYTDGVTEAQNGAGGMLGEERLVERCRSVPRGPAADLVDAVLDEVVRFADGAAQSDDITVLAVGLSASRG